MCIVEDISANYAEKPFGDKGTFVAFVKNAIDIVHCRTKPARSSPGSAVRAGRAPQAACGAPAVPPSAAGAALRTPWSPLRGRCRRSWEPACQHVSAALCACLRPSK